MRYSYILLILLLYACIFSAQQKNSTYAARVLNSIAYDIGYQSIVSEHEWHELQLDRLVEQLDRTQTSFGHWGLVQLLRPIEDKQELLRRQKIIAFLVENENILTHLQSTLHVIHQTEKALLSYWNIHDQLQVDCAQFYYVFSLFKKQLNNSSIALDYSIVTQIVFLFKEAIRSLCMHGIEEEFLTWLLNDKKDFNLCRGIMNGLQDPLRQHSLSLYVLKGVDSTNYSFKDYVRAFSMGSLADRYAILSQGFTIDSDSIGFADLGWKSYQKRAVTVGEKVTAFLGALGPTIASDLKRGAGLYAIFQKIVAISRSLNRLRYRIYLMARFFTGVEQLQKMSDLFAPMSFEQGSIIALQLKECARKSLFFCSRGKFLLMNANIVQEKNSFIPALQSIAFIDAYCSIAQLYKECKKNGTPVCFAQFIDGVQPALLYTDALLPLLPGKSAVTNNFCLHSGDKKNPGKIIITGPNGGGKSAILKTIGIGAVLAQSWTIAFATTSYQTIFSTIKTGLSAHESLIEGLSTFMAEKKIIEFLFNSVQKSDSSHHALILIDEPYKGTVDDESAKRIYEFGKKSSIYDYTLMCIATHVKKPIFLADDLQGLFGNYHVSVEENKFGHFERLFKLMPGPAVWWFEDEEKRGRFIDWIGSLL